MDFEKLKQYRQTANLFAYKLGIIINEISEGYCHASKTIAEDDANPRGIAHGGVYFTLADTAAGTAMASHGYLASTLDAHYNFFRPARPGDCISAEAKEIKRGKTVCVFDVQVTDQNGTLLGTGTFSFYRLGELVL